VIRVITIILCLVFPASAFAATSVVTLSGITINWSGDLTTGQYANGDWYIVAPSGVIITSKTPSDTVTFLHGCELDPDPPDATSISQSSNQGVTHGLDARATSFNSYSATKNICDSFPTPTIPAGSSLVLALSRTTCTAEPQCISAIDVVTVVASAPTAGSFRPPFAGTNKAVTTKTKSDIRYDVLHDYVSQGSLPTLAAVEAECLFRSPLYILASGTQHWEKLVPTSFCNTPRDNYYRGIDWALTDVMAALNSNATNAAKEVMAVRMVQQAIDIYGEYLAGEFFGAWAGFCGPQKEMLIFGASLINDGTLMAAAHPSNAGLRFCTQNIFKRVEQSDIDLNPSRPVACGTNKPTDVTLKGNCLHFTTAMIGRAALCTSGGNWKHQPQNCSAYVRETYQYMASGLVGPAMILSEMSLEEEEGNPAFFEYLLSGTSWPDNRYYSWVRAGNLIGNTTACTGSSTSGPTVRAVVCELMDTHRAGAATDGSISPPPANNPEVPVVSATAPTSGTETTAATVTFSGTASSSAGIASVVTHNSAPGQVDQTATGTTSWTRSRSLTDYGVNVLTATATGSDGGVNDSNAILVLRATSPAATTFDFSLTAGVGQPASWPNLPTIAFTDQGTGNVIRWQNNRAEGSGVFGRHFSFWATTHTDFADNQFSEVTLRDVPATNYFGYATVQAQGTTSTTYDNCSCTAEVGATRIAQVVNSTRSQLGTDIATTWAAGDTLRCEVNAATDVMTAYKNGVSLGTRNGCTLSGGQPGLGVWGTFPVDNFAAGNSAGGDTSGPLVTITVPTTDQAYSTPTNVAAVTISGTATDATDVTACTYLNVQAGVTAATTGEESFTASVDVVAGLNQISISCIDGVAGNPPGVANIAITVPIPDEPDPVTTTRYRLRTR